MQDHGIGCTIEQGQQELEAIVLSYHGREFLRLVYRLKVVSGEDNCTIPFAKIHLWDVGLPTRNIDSHFGAAFDGWREMRQFEVIHFEGANSTARDGEVAMDDRGMASAKYFTWSARVSHAKFMYPTHQPHEKRPLE